jgi:succinate dehydrogenase hydrophobic anchor subunit
MTSRKVAKRGFNLDHVMWLFMRLSALAMYVVALTGLTAALVMGARTQTDLSTLVRWTFFQNPNHVFSSDIVLLDNFINQFWQIMQITMIFFGVTHGLNGLRIVVEDFMGSTIWRTLWRGFIFFSWIFIMLVAIYVVLAS